MLCLDVKMECFARDITLQVVLSHARKITCAEVSNARAYARGLCVVFTPPSYRSTRVGTGVNTEEVVHVTTREKRRRLLAATCRTKKLTLHSQEYSCCQMEIKIQAVWAQTGPPMHR